MCTELKVNKAITTYPASRPRNNSSRNARRSMSVLYRQCSPVPKGKPLSHVGDDSFFCSSLCSPPALIDPSIIFSVLAGFYTTYKCHVEYFLVSCFIQRKINPGGSQVSSFFIFTFLQVIFQLNSFMGPLLCISCKPCRHCC